MDYDINTTPAQIKAVAAWCYDGEHPADVELAVDDRMLVAQQGDDLMAWDIGGEPATDIYLDANPPLDPTGSARHAEAYELIAKELDVYALALELACPAIDTRNEYLRRARFGFNAGRRARVE